MWDGQISLATQRECSPRTSLGSRREPRLYVRYTHHALGHSVNPTAVERWSSPYLALSIFTFPLIVPTTQSMHNTPQRNIKVLCKSLLCFVLNCHVMKLNKGLGRERTFTFLRKENTNDGGTGQMNYLLENAVIIFWMEIITFFFFFAHYKSFFSFMLSHSVMSSSL